jgi:hypothetical protein
MLAPLVCHKGTIGESLVCVHIAETRVVSPFNNSSAPGMNIQIEVHNKTEYLH